MEGTSQCQGQIKPSRNKKGDKTKPSKTHVPENQLNSLQQLTTLAYLHSSQVAGFGVKQGLFKVLLFSMGSLLGDLQLLCQKYGSSVHYWVLLWFGLGGQKLSAKQIKPGCFGADGATMVELGSPLNI